MPVPQMTMTSGGTPIGQQPDVEVVRVEDVKDDLQTLSSDEEFAAFARKDVDWTAGEERALVRQFGGHFIGSRHTQAHWF
jgi:hypothetical protein